MKPKATYILGPGTTIKCVLDLLGLRKTLLGVDLYKKGKVLLDVNERVISYGWLDNGKDLTGYYVLTENYELVYDLSDRFQYKVPRKSVASVKK